MTAGFRHVPLLAGPLVEPSPRWVRVKFGGVFVADSKCPLLSRQYGPGRLPAYYFPQKDVRMDLLEYAAPDLPLEDIVYWTVKAGDRVAEKAAWAHMDPPPELADPKGYVTFEWNRMDAWYEEEEEAFVHARDPHKRVDVLQSSRGVRVTIADETVAETRRPYLLFETGLPTRYYIPREDVRMDLLEPTSLVTRCPYKGIAAYWSAKVGDHIGKNIVWTYPDPIPECPKVKGLLCFFNEQVDLYLDGELQERPHTPWSR